MNFEVELDYISGDDLIKMMKENTKKFQIIDVRGRDIGDLMIKGAINIPRKTFEKDVDKIIETYANYDYVVIHCMRSQQRGPACARLMKQYFTISKYFATSHLKIVVLEGGFGRFYNKHFQESELFQEIE